MHPRHALIASLAALLVVLAYSASALASQPAAPGPATQPAPASESALITATGSSVVPPGSTDFTVAPQTLFITAQSKSGPDDVDGAVAEMQQRLLNIKTALEKLGVPSAGIRFQGLAVQPQFAPLQPGQASPVNKGQPLPQQLQSYTINASMQADVPDLKALVAAMNAATTNGATGVNVSPKGGPVTNTQPPADVLQRGLMEAIANAQATATATAAASGKKLGDIHSVSVNSVFPQCCPQGSAGWNVSVTVSWNIAP